MCCAKAHFVEFYDVITDISETQQLFYIEFKLFNDHLAINESTLDEIICAYIALMSAIKH